MTHSQRAAAFFLVLLGMPAAAQAPAPGPEATRRTPFTHFGAPGAIDLAGDGATAHVDFGARGDELATKAAFRLRYALSPALVPGTSHVRLAFNDQVIGVLPAVAERAGEPAERVVAFDPRLVVGYNRLTMTLVAVPGAAAPDPARPGAWAQVAGTSELELTVRALPVADELASLPEPFFDRHDERRVVVPFVFAPRPSMGTLRAGAIVASWLGSLARWRGARFPASLGEAAPGHAIAFATNAERPTFLASLPAVAGPTLRMISNPADGRSKLLLVMGRDADDLVLAAKALALGRATLAGAAVTVKAFEEPPPRAPWDAPAIVRIDRPMKLSELADGAGALESSGRPAAMEPVRLELRVPPEVAAGNGPGVPLRLKLQYAAPACATEARLEVSIDDELVQVQPLRVAGGPLAESLEVLLPASRLRPRARLAFLPRFALKGDAACRDARDTVRVVVAPDSTIDFSAVSPRARLPDLAGFALLGSPFTRHADLSRSIVVLPAEPAAPDIDAMLALMGRMGDATGTAATRVRVSGPADDGALADADLLVIGAPSRQPLLERWAAALPVDAPGRSRRASPVSFEGGGPVATVMGFESPASSGRSVVAVTAIVAEQLPRVLDALEDGEQRRAFAGAVAYVLPGRVESARVGRAYGGGFVATWDGIGEWIAARPAMMAAIAAGALAFAALLLWALARARRTRPRGASW